MSNLGKRLETLPDVSTASILKAPSLPLINSNGCIFPLSILEWRPG